MSQATGSEKANEKPRWSEGGKVEGQEPLSRPPIDSDSENWDKSAPRPDRQLSVNKKRTAGLCDAPMPTKRFRENVAKNQGSGSAAAQLPCTTRPWVKAKRIPLKVTVDEQEQTIAGHLSTIAGHLSSIDGHLLTIASTIAGQQSTISELKKQNDELQRRLILRLLLLKFRRNGKGSA